MNYPRRGNILRVYYIMGTGSVTTRVESIESLFRLKALICEVIRLKSIMSINSTKIGISLYH